MLESFSLLKKEILKQTESLVNNEYINKDILKRSNMETEIKNLESGEFKIALIAPFSAGKSTFINALIGEDLLSMEVIAETSVITKIKYEEEIGLDIKYRNGEIETLSSNDNEVNAENLQSLLRDKTTVNGENTEDNIESVTVKYPLNICKDNIELIDTPGLFARHEKHEDITKEILPKVNAVIFMIDPESVGETHFTEVIQNYVRNAKSSSLEVNGRHIFFVINKIDNFSKEDIEKAKNELEIVLEKILDEPQIFEVSAYYAMYGKMILENKIDLLSIQKNRKIKITDPEDPDFHLSGKGINKENCHFILEESKIDTLENALNDYLSEKNEYLLVNLKSSIEKIVNESIANYEIQLEDINGKSDDEIETYELELRDLEIQIEKLKTKSTRDFARMINNKVAGGITGNNIANKVKKIFEEDLRYGGKKLELDITHDWNELSIGVTKEDAKYRTTKITGKIQKELEILAKETSKAAFNQFRVEISEVVTELEKELEILKKDFDYLEKSNLGKSFGEIGDYKLDLVLSGIERAISEKFVDIVIDLSKDTDNKVEDLKKSNTSEREKKKFLSWFRSVEMEEVFDLDGFKEGLDKYFDEMKKEVNKTVTNCSNSIFLEMEKFIESIKKDLNNNVEIIINNIVDGKKSLILELRENINSSKEEKEIIARNLDVAINELNITREIIREIEINSLSKKEVLNGVY